MAPALVEDAEPVEHVAARSGVHSVTIYRRWQTPAALVLDVAVEDLTDREPVPATGDLRADLLAYAGRLITSVSRPAGLGLFRALVAAANDPAVGPERARSWLRRGWTSSRGCWTPAARPS